MIFTEPRFLVFFLLVFCIHWALPGHRARKAWLLLCSYAFYAGWDWRFLSLIFTSTLVDFAAGRAISQQSSVGARKAWVAVSCVVNLGLLAFFKYYNFFVESAAAGLEYLGLPCPIPVLEIVLPVGISFYTFQTLSYTIDVYRRRLTATRDLLDFALFVGFFPQLVAGPIVRAVDFLPQLREKRSIQDVLFRANLSLFLFGFVKKACISDSIGPIVDQIFANPGEFDLLSNWLGLALYHLQIYCDFSGYSDMAIASAGLLGYRLPINFDFPYFASSIRTFWRRWHISLSSWLKDYLYVPLGGNRVSPFRTSLNLYIVLVLCGLWHGAGWQYIVFGLIHGVYLSTVQWWLRLVPADSTLGRVSHLTGPFVMTFFLMLSWTVFRSVDFGACRTMLSIVTGLGPAGAEAADPRWWLLVALFFATHWVMYKRLFNDLANAMPDWMFATGLGIAVGLVLPFASLDYRPFIYFQF